MGFWAQHGDAVVVGVFLFVAYLVCLVVALRQQRNIYQAQLARVRKQRDRAKAKTWATDAPAQAVNTEFTAIVQTIEQERS